MNHASQRASAPIDVTTPARPKAPLAGILAGLVLVGGLGMWTFQRIGEAKTVQTDVETKRAADTERAAALAREPLQVRVTRGAVERWQPRIDLDGTLDPQHAAELGFKVGGRLGRVDVEVGDRVRAGALLGQLDQLEAAAQVTASEAQVRAAEASLALAEDAERRTLPLVKNGSFAEASGVQASSQRELARAQLDSARAQLGLTRAGVNNHTLTAPFSGTIVRAPTGVGAVVSPGQSLFELVDTSTLKLSTTVSEDDANLLATGATIHVTTAGRDVSGKVTAILSTLDSRTRRVPVVAEFDNTPPKTGTQKAAEPALRAGAFVRAWVVAEREIPVLRVPHAVLRPGSQDEVLLVTPGTSKLESRRIGYAIAPDGTLLVRRGLEPSDELVIAPIPEAKSGDVVRVDRSTPSATAEDGAENDAEKPVEPAAAPAAKSAAPKAGTP